MNNTTQTPRAENCPNCGAPCTVSGIGYDYQESQNPELLKENEQLKAENTELERLSNKRLRAYQRLHTLNTELLEALKAVICDISAPYGFDAKRIPNESVKSALSAIAKAEVKQ